MNRRREIEQKKKNYCCGFILPMVGINHKDLPRNFINSYISKDNYEAIMIFDKTIDYDVIFYTFLTRIKNNVNFVEHVEEEDEVVLRFKVPPLYHTDFELFTIGKYSKFEESYKKRLVDYFGQKSIKEGHLVTEYNAIYPQDFKRLLIAERLYEKREVSEGVKLIDEVLDSPDLERESFKTIQELTQLNIDKQSTNNYEQSQQGTI